MTFTEPSASHPFYSRYGGGYITATQFLAEGMCARLARRDKVQLAERFWTSPKWAREFRLQATHAGKLLHAFGVEAILAALRSARAKNVYSLGLQSVLKPLIVEEQSRLDQQKLLAAAAQRENLASSELPSVEPPTRPAFVHRPNLLSKLRQL